MPIKVTATLNLKGIPKEIRREFLRKAEDKRAVEAAILEEMIEGRSPVKGEKFKQYSVSYANQKNSGARKPVNMFKSGGLYKSLTITKSGDAININFKGRAILARYHDAPKADSNMPQRRLLPRKAGEEFKKRIQSVINEMLNRAVFRAITKANR